MKKVEELHEIHSEETSDIDYEEIYQVDQKMYMTLPQDDEFEPIRISAEIKAAIIKFMEEKHQEQHIGHEGLTLEARKTFGNIRGLTSWARGVADHCGTCAAVNPHKRGFLHAQHVHASQPFEAVSIDLLGPILHDKVNASGTYKYALIYIDIFTSFTIIRPLEDKLADSVRKELENIISTVGAPKAIHSDGGREFDNAKFIKLIKESKMLHRISAPYNPQSVGKAERCIRSVRELLRKLLLEDQFNEDWHIYLNTVQYILNTRTSTVNRYSPFFLVYNREPTSRWIDYTATELGFNIRTWLGSHTVYKELLKNIEKQRLKYYTSMIKRMDAKRAHTDKFEIGTSVYAANYTDESSFEPYTGPYQVVGHDYRGNHILATFGRGGASLLRRVYPISQLKPVVQADEYNVIEYIENRFIEKDTDRIKYRVKYFGDDDLDEIYQEDILDTNLIDVYNDKYTEFYSKPANKGKKFIYHVKRRNLQDSDMLVNTSNLERMQREPEMISSVPTDETLNIDTTN